MVSRFRLDWMRLCGVIAVALVIFASLMLLIKLEHMRTRHWFTEHFLGYSAASLVVCLGWRHPFVIGAGLAVTAFVLEALQALSPTHSPTLISAIGGASGAVAAAGLFKLIMVARSRRSSAVEQSGS